MHLSYSLTFVYLFCLFLSLTAAGMNEDGSFIGKYGRQKTETSSNAAFATLV